MCGINGILHLQSQKKVDERILTKMRDLLEHRGPDDKGLFIENNIGFGHRRLSILDVSSAGHQPFLSDDGRYVLVYNGEIYNYKEFYPELKSNGFDIRTTSDTEVLMKLFQLHGLKMLNRLNGMFAFAIWDKMEKKLIVVRDRMGVKPLYYSFYNETFYFASEQKALFTAGVPTKMAQDGLEEYIFNRFVAGENTLYQNVKKILPGHIMTIHEDGKTTTEKWWNLKKEIQNQPKIQNPVEWFRETFDDSIKLRMVSDVPVGVLLSGGLDSSSILASLHHQNYKDIQTFNIGFKEKEHNEAHLAKMMAEKFDYGFHTMQLEDTNLYDKLISSTYFQDEPIMHLSEPHLLAVSQMAKPSVKVVLSGEGADELMGGYVRYKALQYPSLLNSIATIGNLDVFTKKPRYEKLTRYAQIIKKSDLVIYNGSNIYPNDIAETFGINTPPKNEYRKQIYKEAKSLYPNNLRRQALYFDQHTYLCSLLDRNDRCTMGASIECREPFLDPRLIVGLGSLEDKWLFTGKKWKFILKKAMQERLPDEILKFRKVGLSAPWGDYITKSPAFKEELESFSKSDLFQIPYFEHINIEKLVQNLQKGDSRMTSYIMPLFMMHIWMKTYATKF
ncbi:asparagine synthase (glutamine-hydrolyzing) [Flavobacterium gawalongense]|uniref:asparagine synthase (glutamine-hydrolyzing) n=1 Tax=Flavobacterium gawalongense TaxID=2594432 RepID=A0A553BZ14_9FLAO|nr:asparagine synthase (glutamine-hydrolyzing) [Flavobacterium gawalongense]TRX13560.1 asparagine synthase (glutamine-hydrolyzing) [Flavobacterium gawalongense]TRX15508.1 asparagine synthase (glutamine-hydrolyzing) [Flavobacterium gawalongense]TRX31347.1 asparagine synthase (glutamine-hydrolyzing) [Flavobacterium gawalongense]